MPGENRVELDLAVPEAGIDQILYAAAFIDTSIRSVAVRNGRFAFELSAPIPEERLRRGMTALIERFGSTPPDQPKPLFELPYPADARGRSHYEPMSGECAQEIYPGLFVYREPVSTFIRFLDWAILDRFARSFAAQEEHYPNCIPLRSLADTSHFTSFPEHLHFLTHLREDLDVLSRFEHRARKSPGDAVPLAHELASVCLVENPSTCYHCYAARRGTRLRGDTAVTAMTKCHRYEAANHAQPGRLLEFSLREVIFLGTPEYVRRMRMETLSLVRELATDWSLYGELVVSNDPFFTADFRNKATHQRRLAMKVEYRAFLPGQTRALAVMSSNLHGPTFSKAFDITMNRRPINTGCLGFGLERMALAVLSQHGADQAHWPERLREDFRRWRSADPLGG